MAIYHLHTKPISRSEGRSAIACAAYRSGERLYSEETDRTFDYRKKGGVVHSEITLCAYAPERFLDRQTLWNEVQKVESKSDSRLAREIEVALPKECSREEHIKIGRDFAEYLASQGMIVDWSIHDKGDGNPHIHYLCTTRPITVNGEWGAKEKKAYKLDSNGERIPVIDLATGKQKIGAKGRRLWQRETVSATGWDSRETLKMWRAAWATEVNRHLEPEQHIDHRSYIEQGRELRSTVHEGYAARKIEQELQVKDPAQHAEIVQKNIEIREQNRLIQSINRLIEELIEKARRLYEKLREFGRTVGDFEPAGRGLPEVTGRECGTEEIKLAIERRKSEAERRESEIAQYGLGTNWKSGNNDRYQHVDSSNTYGDGDGSGSGGSGGFGGVLIPGTKVVTEKTAPETTPETTVQTDETPELNSQMESDPEPNPEDYYGMGMR